MPSGTPGHGETREWPPPHPLARPAPPSQKERSRGRAARVPPGLRLGLARAGRTPPKPPRQTRGLARGRKGRWDRWRPGPGPSAGRRQMGWPHRHPLLPPGRHPRTRRAGRRRHRRDRGREGNGQGGRRRRGRVCPAKRSRKSQSGCGCGRAGHRQRTRRRRGEGACGWARSEAVKRRENGLGFDGEKGQVRGIHKTFGLHRPHQRRLLSKQRGAASRTGKTERGSFTHWHGRHIQIGLAVSRRRHFFAQGVVRYHPHYNAAMIATCHPGYGCGAGKIFENETTQTCRKILGYLDSLIIFFAASRRFRILTLNVGAMQQHRLSHLSLLSGPFPFLSLPLDSLLPTCGRCRPYYQTDPAHRNPLNSPFASVRNFLRPLCSPTIVAPVAPSVA